MTWTRRQFVGTGAATAALAGLARPQESLPPPKSQANSPELLAAHWSPLLEEMLARPMRYRPSAAGWFQVRNGTEFFNRPLYGPNLAFRADGGDLPEFSLYLPGHGGNLRLGLVGAEGAKWLHACERVDAEYLGGRLLYTIADSLLGPGATLLVEAITQGAGLWLRVQRMGPAPPPLELVWAFGGVSGRKGKRNGDIGCEDEPVSRFFQLRPEECAGNVWALAGEQAEVTSGKLHLRVSGPAGARLTLVDAESWQGGLAAFLASKGGGRPVLVGRSPLGAEEVYLRIDQLTAASAEPAAAVPELFRQRREELARVAATLRLSTPDKHLDAMAGALGTAADALWDEAQGCVMHGAVAWRIPLAGWRGPYALSALAQHRRMERHVRRWLARQNTGAVTNGSGGIPGPHGFTGIEPARGAPDPGSLGSRSEALLHSDGDLSKNHYDMNLVFFDVLLRHLRGTGDLGFARECWPSLERHASWERRLFRREYAPGLPLYEAYAAIWASDNLQYAGGGAAHSSAYNLYLNRQMAELARLLGTGTETAYAGEAEAIGKAMRELLWMPERGALAESREWLGERRLLRNPAVWTVYQAIDSESVTELEAWRMCAERLRALRRIPIRGAGVPPDAGWEIGCSDWQPYVWSLTLLTLGENLAFALALFQAGMAEPAYELLRGALLDAGFRGLCPGNFPMSLLLDPHRQESQRDFGDPIGCAARALVEGLWGMRPDLLAGTLRLRPQLPLAWEAAELDHPELHLKYHRDGLREHWEITPRFSKPVALELTLRGRTVELPRVTVNGQPASAEFVPGAIGEPRLVLRCASAATWTVEAEWHGVAPLRAPAPFAAVAGERFAWALPSGIAAVEQSWVPLDGDRRPNRPGVFHALLRPARGQYLLLAEAVVSESPEPVVRASAPSYTPVALGELLTGRTSEILTRGYAEPRSGLCSLALPSGLLGGWANFDQRAPIANLRGDVRLPGGLVFSVPAQGPNCRFVSQWRQDQPSVTLPFSGHARALHLLLAATTFPQATGTPHAELRVAYAGRPQQVAELASPAAWWPVEQDYPVDDYLFRLGDPPPGVTVPWRVDLATGAVRAVSAAALRGKAGLIAGGSAFVLRLETDPQHPLQSVEIHCELSCVVLAVLAVTLES